jgi:hypothetical protein
MAEDSLGELIYEYELKTGTPIEYGTPMLPIVMGQAPPPPAGFRVDIPFEGKVWGKIDGTVSGTDHNNIRADGTLDINITGCIKTSNGVNIALVATGVASISPPMLAMRQNIRLTTANPDYQWVNKRQFWGVGEVNLMTNTVNLRVYG